MKLVQAILTKNPCYTAGRKITVKGLMLHSVGCPQPKASVFINSWNSASFDRACVHAFIDANDGTVYQTLPWNHRCRTDFADIQNKKECGGNRQWQNHYLRNWAANTKGKGII